MTDQQVPICLTCKHAMDAHDVRGGECFLFGCTCLHYEPIDPTDVRR